MRIEQELQQKKFINEYHKARLNILVTSSWFSTNTSQLLKPFNLSWQQFNILRILYGMAPEAASIKILTSRMIDKMSNASRLVEKLRAKGLVERSLDKTDRRKVCISLTSKGRKTIEMASKAVESQLYPPNIPIDEEEAKTLNYLLDKMRSKPINFP